MCKHSYFYSSILSVKFQVDSNLELLVFYTLATLVWNHTSVLVTLWNLFPGNLKKSNKLELYKHIFSFLFLLLFFFFQFWIKKKLKIKNQKLKKTTMIKEEERIHGRFHVKGPRKKVNVKKWIFFNEIWKIIGQVDDFHRFLNNSCNLGVFLAKNTKIPKNNCFEKVKIKKRRKKN